MIASRAVDSQICETEKWGGALAAPERPDRGNDRSHACRRMIGGLSAATQPSVGRVTKLFDIEQSVSIIPLLGLRGAAVVADDPRAAAGHQTVRMKAV